MKNNVKVLVIGDFNFTYNAHHATNSAIEHAAISLGIEADYYWMRLHETTHLKVTDIQGYDGVLIAPGPFENEIFIDQTMKTILNAHVPLLVTGRGFKSFLETIIKLYNLNQQQEKVVSENLFEGSRFDRMDVIPLSSALLKLYKNQERNELSNSRYAIYPAVYQQLLEVIDIEAINQSEEPEIVSLKGRPFCVASMSLPQMTSSRERPHPLISSFFNYIVQV